MQLLVWISCVIVVARDWRGELVFALSKKAKTIIPLQAEMEAIWWSVQLALSHGFSAVCFESDSSSCIEALLKPAASIPWRIHRCDFDVLSLAADFLDWSFRWIHREANGAADPIAKWSIKNLLWGSFDSSFSPSSFFVACAQDCCISSSVI